MALRASLPLVILLTSTCMAQSDGASAQKFWSKFRQAVLHEDFAQVTAMTHFPLEVHGVDDSDAVLRVSPEQFSEVHRRLFEQEIYVPKDGSIAVKTLRELIADKSDLSADELSSETTFRVYQLEFSRKREGWRLTRAYLEE